MKLTDIIALAKNGYTPADIRELLTLANEEQDTTPTDNADESGSDQDGDPGAGEDPDADPEEDYSGNDDGPDYKALFEAEKARRLAAEKSAAHKETGAKEAESDFEIALKLMNEL